MFANCKTSENEVELNEVIAITFPMNKFKWNVERKAPRQCK